MKSLKSWALSLLFVFPFLASLTNAADLSCGVCGMSIPAGAKNHIVLKSSQAKTTLHVCSPTCARKAKKHDSTLAEAEVADFNHPGTSLPGSKAFFLIKSDKIKGDMGEMAMAPYAAAFATQEEALAAQKKYGDGKVVQGLEAALK